MSGAPTSSPRQDRERRPCARAPRQLLRESPRDESERNSRGGRSRGSRFFFAATLHLFSIVCILDLRGTESTDGGLRWRGDTEDGETLIYCTYADIFHEIKILPNSFLTKHLYCFVLHRSHPFLDILSHL